MLKNLNLTLNRRTNKIWGELAEIHPQLVKIDPPKIILNNRMWRTAGQCFQLERIINISTKFYVAGFAGRMNNVILPHEIIHQADFDLFGASDKRCGHGANWCMLMLQFGLEPEKYHTMNVSRNGVKK